MTRAYNIKSYISKRAFTQEEANRIQQDVNKALDRIAQGGYSVQKVSEPIINYTGDKSFWANLDRYGSQGRRVHRYVLNPDTAIRNLEKFKGDLNNQAAVDLHNFKNYITVLNNKGQDLESAKAVLKDMADEADPGVWSSLKNTVPSYLLHAAPAAFMGYYLAPKDWKTTGAVTGGVLGLVANYIRRKSKYGDLIHV